MAASPHLAVCLLFLAPGLSAQKGGATIPFRVHLVDLLSKKKVAERIEIDGRIFEIRDLKKRAEGIVRPGVPRTLALGSAMAEVIVMQLLRERLIAMGAYLSDEDFERAYGEFAAEYDSTPFHTEMIATKFKGFPNLECYRRWWRLSASFEKSIEKETSLATLEAFVRKGSSILSEERLAVDSVFFAAEQNGELDFESARKRAQEAHAFLSRDGSFDELAEKSDPKPSSPFAGKPGTLYHYNQIRKVLGESEHSDLAIGVSAVRGCFFGSSKPKEITQPLVGPAGYWILRLGKRIEWKHRNFTLEVDNRRELARVAYVNHRFRDWIRGVLAKTAIKRPKGSR